MTRFAVRCAVLVSIAWLARTTSVRAQAETPKAAQGLEIAWNGSEDCERGDAVRAKVTRLLGGSQPALASGIKVQVTVRHQKGAHYVAELVTEAGGGVGKKRLEGESCDAVALASSVVIALSIDPNASLDAESESPPPDPPRRAAPPPPPPPRSKPLAKRETRPYLHASVGILLQLVKNASASTGGGVGVRHRRWSLELGGAVYQPRDALRGDRRSVGAELRLTSGELLGCYAFVADTFGALEACPGFRLEYLSAESFGVSDPDEGAVLLGSGAAVVRGRLRATSWLSATLDLGVEVRSFHPTFVLDGVGKIYEIPIVSSFARSGLELEF